ncbi:MAG: carbohydrate porin [Erythrobacter sp.]
MVAPAWAQNTPEKEAKPALAAETTFAPALPSGATPDTAPDISQSAPKNDPLDIKVVASQFVDAPISGDARTVVRYGGRVDGYVRINGSAIGASSKLTLNLRPELRWGEDSNGANGLIPGNTALFRGEGRGQVDLSASLEYKWDSGALLELGKLNILDVTKVTPLKASNGHIGFQNLGISLPPTGIAPNTVTGAFLTVPTKKVIYRLWVFDVDSQYQRSGLEDPFDNGVAFLASATRIANLGGEPGYYTFALVGSSRDDFARDLLPSALFPPPQPVGTFGDESGELAVQLSGYQFIKQYPEAKGKGWGVIARFQATMGDPSFLDYSGYFGIAGNPRFRPQDRFGLAYFHYSLTNELVDDIAFRLELEEEQGVEAFYTYQIDDWLGVTANLQVVDSTIAARSAGVLAGLRLTTQF